MKSKNYTFKIKVREWFDKNSGCWIMFSKKYDICSYGRTKEKAKKMFDFCVDEYLKLTMERVWKNPNLKK